jgi:hypothetical protein
MISRRIHRNPGVGCGFGSSPYYTVLSLSLQLGRLGLALPVP